jgi:hypothetical protein
MVIIYSSTIAIPRPILTASRDISPSFSTPWRTSNG